MSTTGTHHEIGETGSRIWGLTPRQSQHLRDLVRRDLAGRGLEPSVHSDHVRLADRRTLGLNAVALLCRNHGFGEAAWPGAVQRHFDELLKSSPILSEPLSPAQIRAGVHLRLAPLEQMPSEVQSRYLYARHIGGGFGELLAHEYGGEVRFLSDDELRDLDLTELRRLGRERLLAIQPDDVEMVRGNDAEAYVVSGASPFIASKLLVLPELMREIGGTRMQWPDGVLVVVPNRHELVFAPVDENLVANMVALGWLARYDHAHGTGPVSTVLQWWRGGELAPLIDAGAPGIALRPDIPAEFLELYARFEGEDRAA